MKLSSFLQVNLRDVVNGFLIAFLTAFLSSLVTVLETGHLPVWDQLKTFLLLGVTAGVSYVVKNIFSNSQGELLKKDPTPTVNE